MDTKEIDLRFTSHPVTSEQKVSLADMQVRFLELAHAINALLPDGREKSLALTNLEMSMFYADAGIARNKDATSHQTLERSQ